MTKAEHTYLQFSGKENIFYDHSWREILTATLPTPHPTSPMPSVFWGEEFEVVFLLNASSCFHSPIRWSFCSCWLWLKSSPGAQHCKSLCSGPGDSGQTFQSFSILNINIWWILLLISSGEKSQTVDGPHCPVTSLVFPTHRLLFHYIGLQLETWEK